MPQGQVLEFSGATKRFGGVTAVSDFTARVEPGVVTGFLGPNGAGKTTSLRMLLGLVRPTAGTATIEGVRYAKLKNPLQTIGAVLEASSFHPGRTGAGHLAVYAKAGGISKARVDEVLGLVGLADAAGRKVGGYSLGMRQRLGLAYALLGDPGVLVLDEPTNGLDPEGIRWIRGFLRQLAREGRTVFVSSHLLAEVQQTVDALLIISAGRLVFQGGLDELADPAEQATVVDSADRAALAEALRAAGIPFEVLRSGLTVRGIEPASVGLAAAAAGVPLSSLHKRGPALEEVFLDLVNGTRVHASAAGGLHDVIPAIESGAVAVVAAQDETPDASLAAPADAEETAGAVADGTPAEAPAAGASAEEHESPADADASPTDAESEPTADGEADAETEPDALPDADAEDVASVADELDAEGLGAAQAAAMGVAAGMNGTEEEHAAPVEPSTHTASFAVATTGVIDIIPPDEDDTEVDAAESDEEPDDDSPAEGADADEGDDRPWDEYVKTEADRDADRFFAAFDAEADRVAGAEADVESTDAAETPEDSAPDAAPDETEPETEDPETEPDTEDPEAGAPEAETAEPEAAAPDEPEPEPESADEAEHEDHGNEQHEGGEHR